MHVPYIVPCMIQAYSMHITGVFHVCTMHGVDIFHACIMHGTCMVQAYFLYVICIHVQCRLGSTFCLTAHNI